MIKRVLLLALLAAVVAVPIARATTSPAPATAPTDRAVVDPPLPPDPGTTTGTEPILIPDGVLVGGIPVGGMTVEQAYAVVQDAFDQPLRFRWGGIRWTELPGDLGAQAYVDGALQRALASPPGSVVELVVAVDGTAVRDYVDRLARRFDKKPRDATLRLVKRKPTVSEARPGVTVQKVPMRTAIVHALRHGERGPIKLQATITKARVTARNFGAVVVVHRGGHALFLYRGERLVRKLGVAVGQAAYPTPLGRFTIVAKQRNPWWYPPPSPWAQDAKPVPPGPGNPLGTRWMGLSEPFVGIHGTPDAASIGYSASHGCIRMRIPDAEWLFDRVQVGTTVFVIAV